MDVLCGLNPGNNFVGETESGKAESGTTNRNNEKLRKACTDFESMFMYALLDTMRKTVPHGGLFNSSQMNTYTAMLDQKVAEELAMKGGIGLQEVLFRQLQVLPDTVKNKND